MGKFEGTDSDAQKLALFVFLGGFLGICLEGLLYAVKVPIPYTVMVFYVGIFIGNTRQHLVFCCYELLILSLM
jgi:hypothetical protein